MSEELLAQILRRVEQHADAIAEVKAEQVATQTLIEKGVFPRMDKANGDLRMLKAWKAEVEHQLAYAAGAATAFVSRAQAKEIAWLIARLAGGSVAAIALYESIQKVLQ